jgi:hypothetical protein
MEGDAGLSSRGEAKGGENTWRPTQARRKAKGLAEAVKK